MQPESHILVNGVESDALPVNDRGLMYGDGLFETIAVRQGRPRLWSLHIQRLVDSCERLNIQTPDISVLEQEANHLIATHKECVLKILVTRGAGRRGYRPDLDHVPTRIVMRSPLPKYSDDFYSTGIQATLCAARLSKNPLLAGMKHLNRLEQVMARGEWCDEFAEGLMLDTDDRVIEGTMSNVFIIHGNTLSTPVLSESGVSGVMRQHILTIAGDMNIETDIREIKLNELLLADGVFFCNSLIGIWPVQRLLDSTWQRHELVDTLGKVLFD